MFCAGFLSTLFLTGLLDSDMSVEMQRKTGVEKLTARERRALERWIDANYERKAPFLSQAEKKQSPHIEENLRGGRFLRLSDGTLWKIHPSDIPLVQGWITPASLLIGETRLTEYPTKLTNTLTGSSVRAKRMIEE